MQDAISSYLYARQQQQINAIDACTDAAKWHGIHPDTLASHLIDSGIVTGRDADRLALLAADVCAVRASMI